MKSQDFYAFIDDRGENNEIKIHPTANLKGECQIIIEGNDNKIYINEGAVLLNSKLKYYQMKIWFESVTILE